MEKGRLLVVLLGLLVLMSGIQAVQLNELKNDMEEGTLVTSVKSSEQTTQTSLPSSLQNLPQMVGGC